MSNSRKSTAGPLSGTGVNSPNFRTFSNQKLELLSPKEAARYVRKSASSLAKLRVCGNGPVYFKVGSRVYYDLSDLDEWLYRRRVDQKSGARR